VQTQSSVFQGNVGSAAAASVPLEHTAAPMAAERRLVERVFERCDALIREACEVSAVPPEFLGALTANESGGRADAARFEPGVYRHLEAIARGERPVYGSVTLAGLEAEAAELLPPSDAALHARYLTPAFAANHQARIASVSDEVLRQLATSWGYTQIMGYHMVGRAGTVRDLVEPGFHFRLAAKLLSEFAADYRLDLSCEFSEMFCCWNTGRPYGKTFDPSYVANGLGRMRIYRQLRTGTVVAAR
jgi:hypothetical protein